MKILESTTNYSYDTNLRIRYCVGSAILSKLQSQNLWETRTFPYLWSKQATNEREKLWEWLHQSILKRGSSTNVKLDIVWSAGKAGMSR